MSDPLPRDVDGYVDLEALPEGAVELDLAALAPVEPLPDATWDALVSAAPYTDPAATGIDVDGLVDARLEPDLDVVDVAHDGVPAGMGSDAFLDGAPTPVDPNGTAAAVDDATGPDAPATPDTEGWDT